MDLPYFNNSASFSKIIDLQDLNLESFKLEIIYSSCDDELCVFRNETFNIPIDPNKKLKFDDNVTLEDIDKYSKLKFNFTRTEFVKSNSNQDINQ